MTSWGDRRWPWPALIVALWFLVMPSTAAAQAVRQYTNTTAISTGDNNCPTWVTRDFVVPAGDNFTVVGVGIGVVIDHKERGHLRLELRSPGGVTRTIMTNIGGTLNDLNVLFDPTQATSITTHTTLDDDDGVPPYQRTFAPQGVFTGPGGFGAITANGTWTLRMCDSDAAGSAGTFVRADLYLVEPFADLSLTKTVSNANPPSNSAVSYTLTVSSAAESSGTATGVTVQDTLPAGFAYTSSSGSGTYNSTTGVWSVGSVAPGGSASITINGIAITSGSTVTNSAEITAASLPDIDSVPNNGSTTEDDDASVSFTTTTRVAGTPPTVSCPAGSTVFDWSGKTWAVGSLNNNYNVPDVGTFNITVTPDDPLVAGSPAINTTLTGGTSPADPSLFLNMNNNARADNSTTVISFPTAIPGLQFRLFDIDFGTTSYADKVTVTGQFNGSPVTPTLTNGVTNYVVGNVAIGDASNANTSAGGNVYVTFTAPVDTITIVYGNHTVAPADPGNQFMSIHDFATICKPQANLSVTKVSSVLSDPVNNTTNPKAIPGAVLSYCVLISNPGSGTATNIAVSDVLPATLAYVAATMRSGINCGTATTVEDDDATGPDESDPIGMAISGVTITASRASMAPSSSFAATFNVIVQ